MSEIMMHHQYGKRLLSVTNNRNKEFQHTSKEWKRTKFLLSKQLSSVDFCVLNKSITPHNQIAQQKSLNIQEKEISSLRRNCNLPTFTDNKTASNLTQHKLSLEESDLLKAGLYFQPNQPNFVSPIFFLLFKMFIIHFSTVLDLRKLEAK